MITWYANALFHVLYLNKRVCASLCVLLLVACWGEGHVFAQNEWLPVGARSVALGGCSLALSDLWSASENVVALADASHVAAGVAVRSNYLLPNLSQMALSMVVPTGRDFGLGLSYLHAGLDAYSRGRAVLGAAHRLGQRWTVAASYYYDYEHFVDVVYETQRHHGVGVSMRFSPSHEWGATIRWRLPLRNEAVSQSVLDAAVNYRLLPRLLLVAQADYASRFGVALRTGVEYTGLSPLALRVGYSSNPSQLSFGLGYKATHFVVDVAALYHTVLGVTPLVSLWYEF
ncbi:MAG: hypothetical protein IJV22_01670 [Bacteroidales bacterium]|nr:hypothetical protein [Bacteroidales bacterium]